MHHCDNRGTRHPIARRPLRQIPVIRRRGTGDFGEVVSGGRLVRGWDLRGLVKRGAGRAGLGKGFPLDRGLVGCEEGGGLGTAGIVGGVFDGGGEAGDGKRQRVAEVVRGGAGGEEESKCERK